MYNKYIAFVSIQPRSVQLQLMSNPILQHNESTVLVKHIFLCREC